MPHRKINQGKGIGNHLDTRSSGKDCDEITLDQDLK